MYEDMYTRIKITDVDLIVLLKNKDQTGYSILYNNYAKILYRVLIKIVQSDIIAADLLQESFIKIWKNLDYYDASKASLFTWMFNITRNLAIDQIHSSAHKQSLLNIELEKHTSQVDTQHQVEAHIDALGLQVIVEKLQPMYQQIIDLVYYRGYSLPEISKEFNIPLGTVKSRMARAILHLRKKTEVEYR